MSSGLSLRRVSPVIVCIVFLSLHGCNFSGSFQGQAKGKIHGQAEGSVQSGLTIQSQNEPTTQTSNESRESSNQALTTRPSVDQPAQSSSVGQEGIPQSNTSPQDNRLTTSASATQCSPWMDNFVRSLKLPYTDQQLRWYNATLKLIGSDGTEETRELFLPMQGHRFYMVLDWLTNVGVDCHIDEKRGIALLRHGNDSEAVCLKHDSEYILIIHARNPLVFSSWYEAVTRGIPPAVDVQDIQTTSIRCPARTIEQRFMVTLRCVGSALECDPEKDIKYKTELDGNKTKYVITMNLPVSPHKIFKSVKKHEDWSASQAILTMVQSRMPTQVSSAAPPP